MHHCQEAHEGIIETEDGIGEFKMKLISSHMDPLSRVLREDLDIQESERNKQGGDLFIKMEG